ncbi:hypothetical protein HY639_00130 [Candidatus Woesearchaeota archaeon]|nr:hypothetical protein [Candidatus Woesearchaeota archaeon]
MNWASGIGYAIVVGTHIYMLVLGLPASQMAGHAIINLVAAGLLWYAHQKE